LVFGSSSTRDHAVLTFPAGFWDPDSNTALSLQPTNARLSSMPDDSNPLKRKRTHRSCPNGQAMVGQESNPSPGAIEKRAQKKRHRSIRAKLSEIKRRVTRMVSSAKPDLDGYSDPDPIVETPFSSPMRAQPPNHGKPAGPQGPDSDTQADMNTGTRTSCSAEDDIWKPRKRARLCSLTPSGYGLPQFQRDFAHLANTIL
jgi:hypothetical protein